MGRFGDSKVKALTVGLVLGLFALVGTTVWGLLQGLLALLAPGSQPLLAAVVGAVAPWLLASILLVLLSGGLLLWLVITLASRISLPSPRLESERLSRLAAGVEYYVPAARAADLSGWLAPPEPTAEEKLAQVKEDYVEGKISGETFERKVEQLHREEEALDRSSMPSRLDKLLDDADRRAGDTDEEPPADDFSRTAVVDAMDVTVVDELGDDDEPATEQA
ncbi:hypothetical protein [Haloarchaeobius litoreus]|uniref:hypothetical protein n=1 Tax=Haloarchaeobius litoreus TaxID=755306 RepID=UPI0021118AB0|nr:hypothetical protein [Haloarchaeobius litoreus]